ncbi:MAG: T9SS type A sorting domain-containing protein, partial [Bacteroidales bacterium]|nr:T9SS type A sorting domain-containing protein [Bacteroidales bacterium]
VKVFPNPANDFVNVQCTMYNVQLGADLHVFDVYGKLVQTVPMTGETTAINVSSLADGMYFVRVTTEAGDVTKPFVVKR